MSLEQAIQFAVAAHAGQKRKGTTIPYVVHPLAVGRILLMAGCAEPVAVAGILHDTVEDTPVTLDEIRSRFGEQVALLVKGASEPDKEAPWEDRKRHTLGLLETAPADMLLLSLADKLDNLRSIRVDFERQGERVWERFNRPRGQQEWYYRSLSTVFGRRLKDGPGRALCATFAQEVAKVFG
jgi:(p)ppGpp synthase/HD superfamily hydrolase